MNTLTDSDRGSVESTDLFADLRPLENGERICEGDLFLWQDRLSPATDIGNGIMSDNHFPHFRPENADGDARRETHPNQLDG
jgi:hypothetical protein